MFPEGPEPLPPMQHASGPVETLKGRVLRTCLEASPPPHTPRYRLLDALENYPETTNYPRTVLYTVHKSPASRPTHDQTTWMGHGWAVRLGALLLRKQGKADRVLSKQTKQQVRTWFLKTKDEQQYTLATATECNLHPMFYVP